MGIPSSRIYSALPRLLVLGTLLKIILKVISYTPDTTDYNINYLGKYLLDRFGELLDEFGIHENDQKQGLFSKIITLTSFDVKILI